MKKKLALVTGGSRGIGLAIIKILKDNEIEVLAPTKSELDLSSIDSIKLFFQKNSDLKIDILINNAGVNVVETISQIDQKNLINSLQINLVAPILLVQEVSAKMIEQGYGKIVNISSIWSQISKPGRAVYSSAKSAINGFTKTAALELAPHNILVNAVAPGFVDTDMTRKNNSADQLKVIESNIPLKRLANASEIAELVHFLVSEKNTYITGQTIFIDGGFTCQ